VRTFKILLKKELRTLFVSPMAYIILTAVMILSATLFRLTLAAMQGTVSQQSVLYMMFNSNLFWLIFFVLFPLITMRLFAEEKKMGTLETLMTAPVNSSSIILAKFTSALVFYAAIWAPSAINLIVFESITQSSAAFSAGSFWGTYLILFLFGLFYIAMGCFASALTSNQLVAAVIALALVTLHFLFGFLPDLVNQDKFSAGLVDGLRYFSAKEHMQLFSQGLIDSRPFIYYPTSAALFLLFTYYVLEFRRWRS